MSESPVHVTMHSYPIRFAHAWARHWLAILIGSATGLYVATAACFGLMIVDVSYNVSRFHEEELALAMNAILFTGMFGGGFLGYIRRRR